jgi:glycerate dehydrogenase
MKGVILDADSLGQGQVDLSPITCLLDGWDVHGTTQPHEIQERIEGADIVLSNKIVLDEATLKSSQSLQFISIMATGTNNVDLNAASSANITVSNAVAYATPSVVQHTISLMLNLATSQHKFIQDVRQGEWQKAPAFCLLNHPISELSNKTLGIIGYGELGSNVATIAKAFGMNILVAQRPGSAEQKSGRIPLNELLDQVDYLSLHCPLTPETENLINASALARMKSSAFLINTARGGLVDSNDLIAALKEGSIAGAAVDVLNTEPPTADDTLASANLENLLVTPHNAWAAIESRQRLVIQMVENIEQFLNGKPVRVVSTNSTRITT